MKQRKSYRTYTREFKQEAVRLMATTDRPATDVAMELGIRRNQLYKWKEQLAVKGDAAFSGRGRPRTENLSELALLKYKRGEGIKI
jgi:transposase